MHTLDADRAEGMIERIVVVQTGVKNILNLN
jgi:hypothetical protein